MPTINVNDAYILDETGAEVDKVTGLFTKNENASTGEKQMARLNIAAGGSNRNLLDNAYFVGGGSQLGDGVFPINQRGLTSYSSAQVTIDRWTLFGGSVVLASDGITVTSSPDFGQVFEPSRLPVGTYTASVATASGEFGSITFTTTGSQFFAGGAMGNTGVTLNFIDLWTPTSSLFSLQCQGVKIAAAKLEPGTVSTLPNDMPPNWWQELEKCQHYLWVVSFPGGSILSTGYASSGFFITDIILPTTMRATNLTLTFNNNVLIIGNGTAVVAASVIGVTRHGNHLRTYVNPASALTDQYVYAFVASADTIMVVSAEL